MEKMLIIGNADSYWYRYYVEHVALPLGYETSVQLDPLIKCKYIEYYRANHVSIVGEYQVNKFIMKIPKIRSRHMLRKRCRVLKPQYDVVVAISATESNLLAAKAAVKPGGKVVVLVIGSDVLRVSNKTLRKLDTLLYRMNAQIACSAQEPYKKISTCFKKSTCLRQNVIPFALPTLERIRHYLDDGCEPCKRELNIDTDKLTVCVGYNARPEQQHQPVITSLSALTQEEKEKMHIVLPMTYMGNNVYCDSVEALLRENGFAYSILKDFRDADQMAKLWIACDIFINAQTTDAMSASLMECLCAGVTVLNAHWLQYDEIQALKVEMNEFDAIEELPEKVRALMDTVNFRDMSRREVIGKNYTLETFRGKWHNFLTNTERK